MKQNTILTLFALFIAVCAVQLCSRSPHSKTEVKQAKVNLTELKESAKSIGENYSTENARLQKREDSLELALSKTRRELEAARKKYSLTAMRAERLIGTTSKEQSAACASLIKETTELLSQSSLRDSLSEKNITSLEALITVKDSALQNCDQGYRLTMALLDSSITMQEGLIGNLKAAQKSARREKTKVRLLSAAAMVLAGVSTSLLLTSGR